MAPEYPPAIVILDTRFEDGLLKGEVRYIETAEEGRPLRVRWHIGQAPANFTPIGKGVAYIYNEGPTFAEISISDDTQPPQIGPHRYQWTEGLQFDALMFILILPANYTAIKLSSKPVGTKIFDHRLAIYWIVQKGGIPRASFEWTLKPIQSSLAEELLRFNQENLATYKQEASSEQSRSAIRKVLTEKLDETDIKVLCFDENVDPEQLSGANKAEKIISLMTYFERRNQLAHFLQAAKMMRPDLPF